MIPPGPAARISVVIATRNRRATLLGTLQNHDAPTIVVDNASTDGTADAITRTYPHVRIVRLDRNLGAAARNMGVALADTPYVAFADDDSYWATGSLAAAAALLDSHPRAGLICARVLVGDGDRLDPVSQAMATAPLGWGSDLPGPTVLGFLACAAVVRRSAFLSVGGFNELLVSYGEEELLALDLAATGWGLAYVDDLVVHHHPSPKRIDAAARTAREVRNRLLTAWLRRRAAAAGRITADVAIDALGDANARAGLIAALRLGPRVVRLRRPVPRHVEQSARRLGASQGNRSRGLSQSRPGT